MNALFAAGLLDNPWIVAVIVIGGAVANWLAKRRQDKAAQQQPPEADEPSPAAGKPPGEFNLEDALRRLMGEEAPASIPAPPPLPAPAQGQLPPRLDWQEEAPSQPTRRLVPAILPPTVAVRSASLTPTAASEEQAQVDRRFEQLNEAGRHPAMVVSHGHRSRASRRTNSRWRDPRNARQGFVASVIFAPPKSLEP